MDNWYFIYDSSGIDKKGVKDLSLSLEKLGYKYNKCTGLGAGPSVEQIILWIHNNQFLSGVSMGILSNYFYDVLKNLYTWFKTHKHRKKTIPTVEFFLSFKDIKNKRTRANLKFRIDKYLDKETLKESLKSQVVILHSSSDRDTVCFYCKKIIPGCARFYLKRNNLTRHICQDCINKELR